MLTDFTDTLRELPAGIAFTVLIISLYLWADVLASLVGVVA